MEKNNKKSLLAAYKEQAEIGGIYSITNTVTGNKHLFNTQNVAGSKNRFDFAKTAGSGVYLPIQKEWEEFGADAFVYEELETLEKKETQTSKEFKAEIMILEEIWREKLSEDRGCNL